MIPALLLVAGLASVPSPAVAVTCPSGWTTTTTQNPGAEYNSLVSVDALSINDAWGIGYGRVGGFDQTLAEHWNGSTWTIFPTPDGSANDNDTTDVAMAATDDVWAVGDYTTDGTNSFTLIERWTGASWAIVPSPTPGDSTEAYLAGVTVAGPNDVWAVGSYRDAGTYKTLTLHWNGATWTQVSSPNPGAANAFYEVSATSSSNVWAAGSQRNAGTYQSLVEHWTGTKWKVVTSPNKGVEDSPFTTVAAISNKNVWFGGNYRNNDTTFQAFIGHWNGTKIVTVAAPASGTGDQLPYDMDAVSANEIWFVGQYETNSIPSYDALVLRWNGTKWKTQTPNNPGSGGNAFFGVSAVAPNTLIAVGRQQEPSNTLGETRCP